MENQNNKDVRNTSDEEESRINFKNNKLVEIRKLIEKRLLEISGWSEFNKFIKIVIKANKNNILIKNFHLSSWYKFYNGKILGNHFNIDQMLAMEFILNEFPIYYNDYKNSKQNMTKKKTEHQNKTKDDSSLEIDNMQSIPKGINLLINDKNKKFLDDLAFFNEYREAIEKPLIGSSRIDYTRSFNLLTFMLKTQCLKEFIAFDLAFVRWEEILKPKEKQSRQILNFTQEILNSTLKLFPGRCDFFRRILTIRKDKIDMTTVEIIQKLYDFETQIREKIEEKGFKTNTKSIETRVLICSNETQYATYFSDMNDFAMFIGQNEEFAIVETSLTSPFVIDTDNKCELETNPTLLATRKRTFNEFWENTKMMMTLNEFINKYDKKNESNN